MIPNYDIPVDQALPPDVVYWQPKPSDIDEEGFGFFQNVWPLGLPSRSVAHEVLKSERAGLKYLARVCRDDVQFDAQAERLEGFHEDDSDCDPLPPELAGDWTGLNGLEVGVAGLSYMLASTGFYPAASCRAHPTRSWAPCPSVLFAAGEMRLQRLLPLIEASGCGLAYSESRGVPLFDIYAPSVKHMSSLAESVLADYTAFRVTPKTTRRRRRDNLSADEQLPLGFEID